MLIAVGKYMSTYAQQIHEYLCSLVARLQQTKKNFITSILHSLSLRLTSDWLSLPFQSSCLECEPTLGHEETVLEDLGHEVLVEASGPTEVA